MMQAAASAAAAAAPLPVRAGAAAPQTADETRNAALRLAVETLRPDWPLLVTTTVLLVATIACTLAFPLAIGEVFDVVRAQGVTAVASNGPAVAMVNPFSGAAAVPPSFQTALAKLAACLVASATGNAIVSYFSTLVGERFGHRLKGRLMETIVSQEQTFFDSTTNGDLVARLTLDVQVLQATLADFIGQRGFRSMFEVVGALLLISVQQPLLALVSLAITPLLSRLLRSVVVRSSAIIYRRQQVAAESLGVASERLTQVQTVQVFAQQAREAAAFGQLSKQGLELSRKYALFQGIVEGAGRLAVNIGTVALLGFGGLLVINNKLSVGTLLAVNVFNLFISVGLSSVAASLGELGKAIGALERVAELVAPPAPHSSTTSSGSSDAPSSSSSNGASAAGLGAPAAVPVSHSSAASSSNSHTHLAAAEAAAASSHSNGGSAGPAAAATASSSGRVEFRDVWFKYPGANDWAISGLSLTLLPGQTLALVGPSGGGKSTIAALLLGLYHPQQGQILVDGVPLPPAGSGGRGAMAVGMAAVLQQPMLMSGSVMQQISYGNPDAGQDEIMTAAHMAHADEFVQQLPQGYDTEVGERGHALSGGQKQRLAIARALLIQPKILVLDEVTSALDVRSERFINDTLRRLKATKLIIAHRLSTVRRADVIAVVEGGRVVEMGSRAELMSLVGGIYQRLVTTSELGSTIGSSSGVWVKTGATDDSGSEESEVEDGAQEVARAAPATP